MSDWAQIITKATGGDSTAMRELLGTAYLEIKAAAQFLLRGRPEGTLQTTALVHEAFRRVLEREAPPNWESPEHFFNSMATIMRNIVREHARAKRRYRRDPGCKRIPLEDDAVVDKSVGDLDNRLALDEALTVLARRDEAQARIVELRCYCGLTIAQTARVTGLSEWQVSNGWSHAKAWLQARLGENSKLPECRNGIN